MSNLEEKIEENIFLRAIEFGMRHPEGFTYMEIIKSLNLKEESNEWKKKIIGKYLHSAYLNARQTKLLEHNSNIETPFCW
ncbi:MAG: hypothetical protein WD335_02370 [Candidatus Paceibacterota bacterium]